MLGACSEGGQPARDEPPQQAGASTPSASARATAGANGSGDASAETGPAGPRAVAESTELYEFEYAYPAAAAAIPGLRAMLEERLAQTRADLEQQARRSREEARESGFPYNPHSTRIEWKVVADLPRYLSLSADISTYSGGAHGNRGYDSLIWDREEDAAKEPLDFFRSPSALQHAVGGRFCTALDAQRTERRDQPVESQGDDIFDKCPRVSDLTVLLGSSNGETFDRLGLIAAPYVAGPWAEGSYEVTLGVDTALLDAVKHEYRDVFALDR